MRRLLTVFALLVLASCSERNGVRAGIKPFAEQEILAETIDGLLVDRGIATRPPYRCRDTFDCARALQEGRVDFIVEYTGTALHFLGEEIPEATDERQLFAAMNRLYEPIGAEWIGPLGFDNGYVWLVESRRAHAESLTRISDLRAIEDLEVASPPEYLRRPRDGLQATAGRYGLDLAPEPLVMPEPLDRYAALRDGKADVAIGYATDGNLAAYGVATLEDDLEFFPQYAAAIVARDAVLAETPGLEDTLLLLTRRIDKDTMRGMNHAVVIDGDGVQSVAHDFLHASGLVTEESAHHRRAPVRLALRDGEAKQIYGPAAVAAIRKVFADRPVRVVEARDPWTELADGSVQLAILGADDFFGLDRRGRLVRRRHAEAITVLGRRVVHVLVPKGGGTQLAARIGIEKGDRLTEALLELVDRKPAGRDTARALIDRVGGGELEAAILVAEVGDPQIAEALEAGRLELGSIRDWLGAEAGLELPYLRPSRISETAYPGLVDAVDTFAVQVLLAGAARNDANLNASGPAAALPTAGKPLPRPKLEALAQAVGNTEAPDPVLPSMWTLAARPRAEDDPRGAVETALNVFVLAFLVWLFVVVVAPARPETS